MNATTRTHNFLRQHRMGTETGLYEQQARLRDFSSQRFGSSTPFQQPHRQNMRFR